MVYIRVLCVFFLLLFICIKDASAFRPTVDFDADGRGDLFVRNPYSGAVSVWLTDGARVLGKHDLGTVAPSTGWTPLALRDFNGDGTTDLLWRNVFSGDIGAWLLHGGSVIQSGSFGALDPSSGWGIIGLEDVNGDLRADIILRNGFSGTVAVWLVDGVTTIGSAEYATVPPDSGWDVLALKDVSGDGLADLLWRHAQSGDVTVWLLSGGTIAHQGSYGTVLASTGWAPIALEDVNNDGRADLLWRNFYSGDLSVWLLDGGSIQQSTSYGALPLDSGWTPLGLADFNADGSKDILWYNMASGQYMSWLLSGAGVMGSADYGTVAPASGWVPTALDDLDGDGRADILWYNAFDYGVISWLISDFGIAATPFLDSLPPPSLWVIGG